MEEFDFEKRGPGLRPLRAEPAQFEVFEFMEGIKRVSTMYAQQN